MSTLSSMQEVVSAFRTEYAKTHKKLKILDAFSASSLLTAVILLAYALVVGSYPFNAFLAAFFCALGCMVLTVSLRAQVDPAADPAKARRKFGEYAFAMGLLFLASLNYIG